MKRNDAKQVFDIPAYNKCFPFVMKRRCDSLVYHTFELDVTNALDFVHEYNNNKPEVRLKFFYVFCAALLRTIAVRPELNRFIAAKRYWQRNELSMNFVVKEEFTDEAPEISAPLYFAPEMVLDDYVKIMDKYITDFREEGEDNSTERAVNFFFNHFPYWIISIVVKLCGLFDSRGKSPFALRDADGLHTSVFVSNLGSIGIPGGSPHHHLYEWGTTSLFVTLGSLRRQKEFAEDGSVTKIHYMVDCGLTVDERISSGFYMVKSINVLQNLLNNPSELLEKPVLPPAVLTKREYLKSLKKKKLEESKKSHS